MWLEETPVTNGETSWEVNHFITTPSIHLITVFSSFFFLLQDSHSPSKNKGENTEAEQKQKLIGKPSKHRRYYFSSSPHCTINLSLLKSTKKNVRFTLIAKVAALWPTTQRMPDDAAWANFAPVSCTPPPPEMIMNAHLQKTLSDLK